MTEKDLRASVLNAAHQYFLQTQQPSKFVAGETYIPVSGKVLDPTDLEFLIEASLDLWLTAGRFASDFEQQLPLHMNRKTKALFVNSGSSANLLAVSAFGATTFEEYTGLAPLEKGAEIITVAAAFPTTVNPIIQNGWVPVFVDIDPLTLNALPETIMAARTSKTRAVVLAHTLGNPYRADILAEWCRKEGLYLMEDCCDALGAEISTSAGWAPVGSFGDYATLSFYPAHHMTTGEGGAIIAKDGRWRRVAESLRDWGRDCWCEPGFDNTCGKRFDWQLGDLPCGYDHKYIYSNIGYNLKGTDMQAALGLSQLRKVTGFIEARRNNWKRLYDGIVQSPLLHKALQPIEATAQTNPSWFGFAMHCREGIDRDKLVRFLEDHRVGTRMVFGGNLVKQPAYKNAVYRLQDDLLNTNKVMEQTFWIGVYPGLGQEHTTYMLQQLEAGVKQQIL